MEILEAVKQLAGIETKEQDGVLQLMIEDASAAVRDYCNRKDCPPELAYVVREIVLDHYRLENEDPVASIKRGDTQISYQNTITKDQFTPRQRDAMCRYRLVKVI
ncbi:hypothetical protein D7X87_20550 [bacterium D16-54]|nr:hypothetical protein D7X87_20550 [bacterium D16-54]RKJ11707.1 hypothetical protein D7X65_20985 [bacterium D16-56]